MSDPIKFTKEGFGVVVAGMEMTIDTIEWRDPYWEFDHPSAVLSPVFLHFESGSNHEHMVEGVCIDALCGTLKADNCEAVWGWRGYSEKNLRRVFNAALKGKKFPKLKYTAKRTRVRFFKDKNGELTCEDV